MINTSLAVFLALSSPMVALVPGELSAPITSQADDGDQSIPLPNGYNLVPYTYCEQECIVDIGRRNTGNIQMTFTEVAQYCNDVAMQHVCVSRQKQPANLPLLFQTRHADLEIGFMEK